MSQLPEYIPVPVSAAKSIAERYAKSTGIVGRVAIQIVNEAFEEWSDERGRCGKILRALGDPTVSGYRADIDAIHEAVKKAEKFLARGAGGGQ